MKTQQETWDDIVEEQMKQLPQFGMSLYCRVSNAILNGIRKSHEQDLELPGGVEASAREGQIVLRALQDAEAFIGVMFGDENGNVPVEVVMPLGIPVKLGKIQRDIGAAIKNLLSSPGLSSDAEGDSTKQIGNRVCDHGIQFCVEHQERVGKPSATDYEEGRVLDSLEANILARQNALLLKLEYCWHTSDNRFVCPICFEKPHKSGCDFLKFTAIANQPTSPISKEPVHRAPYTKETCPLCSSPVPLAVTVEGWTREKVSDLLDTVGIIGLVAKINASLLRVTEQLQERIVELERRNDRWYSEWQTVQIKEADSEQLRAQLKQARNTITDLIQAVESYNDNHDLSRHRAALAQLEEQGKV